MVYHDGTTWNVAPSAIPNAAVLGVDVGADGVPFALGTVGGAASLYPFDTGVQT